MKNLLSLALCVLMLCSLLAGCGETQTPADNQGNSAETEESIPTTNPATVSIGSGTSGGAFYMVGAALAQTIQKYDSNLSVNSEATGGTSENIALVSSEETTIGMGMCDDIITAYSGERDYEGNAASNLRVMMSGQTNTFHIIVRADSDIHSLTDIKGKRVSLGPSGAPYFGPDMIEATTGYVNGQDYTGQYLGHDQAAEALQNGDIDVLIATLAYPASAYANMALSVDVRFISLTEDEMSKAIAAHPAWKDTGIPAGTYEVQTEDVYTPAVPVWLFTYENVSDDVIYRCVKAILEHSDELGTIHADAGKYTLETATAGLGEVPIHNGALLYYKEMGVM